MRRELFLVQRYVAYCCTSTYSSTRHIRTYVLCMIIIARYYKFVSYSLSQQWQEKNREKKRKTDFRSSDQNRKAFKTKRNSRSHTILKMKKSGKIRENIEKRIFEARIRIDTPSKLQDKGGSRYHTNFKILKMEKHIFETKQDSQSHTQLLSKKILKNVFSKLESESKCSQNQAR